MTLWQRFKVLFEVWFERVELVGAAWLYWTSDNWVRCFPAAADEVVGKPAPVPAGVYS